MDTTNSNLTSIIELIYFILSQSIVYISDMIRIIAFYFNILLKVVYESFVKKLKEHKSKIEQNIKNYIKQITEELTKRKPKVNIFEKSIENIESQIGNFDTNYKQIYHLSGYHTLNSIINPKVQGDIGTIYDIFRTLVDYRNDLREFNKNKDKSRFLNYTNLLKSYSRDITKVQMPDTEQLSDYISAAHRISGTLGNLKTYIDELNKNMESVQKLQKIGEHITTLKLLVNKVHDKIKPHLKEHIDSLVNIDFDYTKFHLCFTKIQRFTETFVEKYKIANNAIKLHKSLESQISEVTGINFSSYDIDELIKNSNEIKNKIKSFETIGFTSTYATDTSDNHLSEINRIEKEYSSDISFYLIIYTNYPFCN